MKIGLRSEDWIPPLMHYYATFGDSKIDTFLKKLEYKFSGDWVCGITPTSRLDAMNNILKAIDKTDLRDLDKLLNNKQLFKIDEAEFKNCIKGNIYSKQYCRYLLLKIECLLSDNTVHLSGYKYITVEHVLPQNPKNKSQWREDFTDDERELWTNKLANLVLISQKKNSALGNLDFDEKKEVYLKKRIDAFHANKVFISKKNKWKPETLEKRQEELIDILVHS
jgi:hypothetical protein